MRLPLLASRANRCTLFGVPSYTSQRCWRCTRLKTCVYMVLRASLIALLLEDEKMLGGLVCLSWPHTYNTHARTNKGLAVNCVSLSSALENLTKAKVIIFNEKSAYARLDLALAQGQVLDFPCIRFSNIGNASEPFFVSSAEPCVLHFHIKLMSTAVRGESWRGEEELYSLPSSE